MFVLRGFELFPDRKKLRKKEDVAVVRDSDMLDCYKKYHKAKKNFLERGGDVFDAMEPVFYASVCHLGLDFMECCYDKISFLGGRYDDDRLRLFDLSLSELTADELKDAIGLLWLLLTARELHFRFFFFSKEVASEMIKLFHCAMMLRGELEERLERLSKEVEEEPSLSDLDSGPDPNPLTEVRTLMAYCDYFLLSFSYTGRKDYERVFDGDDGRNKYFAEHHERIRFVLRINGFWGCGGYSGHEEFLGDRNFFTACLSERAFREIGGELVPYEEFAITRLICPGVHDLSKFILQENIRNVSMGLYERFSGACGEGGEDA